MEKKLKEYEKYIAAAVKRDMSAAEKAKLAEIHCETVANFQHERLIHLIITLFFAALTIIAVVATAFELSCIGFMVEVVPVYLLTLILVILSFFYVKHYYFLENHIQMLYKYTKILRD